MYGRGAVAGKSGQVLGSSVPFMAAKAVCGILLVPEVHEPVPGHLRDDRGRGDMGALSIALNDAGMRQNTVRNAKSIDERIGGPHLEARERAPHRDKTRLSDIESVDLVRFHNPDPDRERLRLKLRKNGFPCLGRELFTIVKQGVPPSGREDDGPGHHRSSQGTTTRFIDAGDEAVPL